MPEVSLGLLQLAEGEVSSASPVVALDVGRLQRDGLGGIHDGAACSQQESLLVSTTLARLVGNSQAGWRRGAQRGDVALPKDPLSISGKWRGVV